MNLNDWLTLDQIRALYESSDKTDLLDSLNSSAKAIQSRNSDACADIRIKGKVHPESGRVSKIFMLKRDGKEHIFRSVKEMLGLIHSMGNVSTISTDDMNLDPCGSLNKTDTISDPSGTTITMIREPGPIHKKRKISNEQIYDYLKRVEAKLDRILDHIQEEDDKDQEFIDDTENNEIDPSTRKELDAICQDLRTPRL